jgi:hypothetical protein
MVRLYGLILQVNFGCTVARALIVTFKMLYGISILIQIIGLGLTAHPRQTNCPITELLVFLPPPISQGHGRTAPHPGQTLTGIWWFYGGASTIGPGMSDLWKYDITTDEWTCMGNFSANAKP